MTLEELKEKYNVRSFTDDEWDWIKQLIDNSVESAERTVLERVREKLPKRRMVILNTPELPEDAVNQRIGYNQALQEVDDILKELTTNDNDK